MVSTNFVVDRCENTSFQGGGGAGKSGKGSYRRFTSPHQTICTASILLLNCSASPRSFVNLVCGFFFCFSLIRSEIDKPLGFDRDFDI